jgi:hypothetical protein
MSLVDDILIAEPEERAIVFKGLTQPERAALYVAMENEINNPWSKYKNEPVSFVTEVLGEQAWSKQVEILESLRDNRRTAVPACHAPGKSHIAARAISWWVTVHAPETVRVVTTATTFRQVKGILWPHIRGVASRNNLPGEVLTTEWKIGNTLVADGFSASDNNESAVQGIHAENLLIVVDEAGGISTTIGNALEALMTGGHTRLLLLGNPPTDNMGSWFERACSNGMYEVIRIAAKDTPNFTGEKVGPWSKNLVDKNWVDEVTRSFGEESAFVQARVHARFPRTTTSTVIPVDWAEIRLGVDIAADGGDEFVIAEQCGNSVRIVHGSRGNKSPVEVAGRILEAIKRAEAFHVKHHIEDQVRVKIDAIGVGWGVAGLLDEWGKDEKHESHIVAVNVAQSAGEREKFANQRAEMWWTARELLQPDEEGEQFTNIDCDSETIAQLSAPSYRANSSGKIQIESKDDMKKRGVQSPDRAEAVLLALFDPPNSYSDDLVAPLSITSSSAWF